MRIVQVPQELDAAQCAFVPTMGALHEGHAALIRAAAGLGRPVVVSIFVNPTQFGPGEDFERYPRRLDDDVVLAGEAGADVIFAPCVEMIYPAGSPAASRSPPPSLPDVATLPGLEDAFRPGHFAGVCQVVARLFDLVRPRWAVFGEKDFQQLRVIEALVAEAARGRWGALEIVAHPTQREPSGLALSSRNAYLDDEQGEKALGVVRALRAARKARSVREAEAVMRETLEAHGLAVDYAAVRDARTLMPVESLERPCRALIAARVGQVRLIDNMAMR